MPDVPVPESLSGRRFGLIADAHVHPGKSPPLPVSLAEHFSGVDMILVLGDLGEASGLDALAKIAPVKGVVGADDAHGDNRLVGTRYLFTAGGLAIGALFDGSQNGLYLSNDPFEPRKDFGAAAARVFGRKPDVLLSASTHKPMIAWIEGTLIVDPGSPTLSDTPSVAILEIGDGYAKARHVRF